MCICAMLNRAFIEAELCILRTGTGFLWRPYAWKVLLTRPPAQSQSSTRQEQTELDTTQLFLKLYYNSCNYFVNHRKTSSSYSKMNFFVVENLHIMWKYPYLNPEIYNHNQLVKIYVLKVIRYKCVLLCLRIEVIFLHNFVPLHYCLIILSSFLNIWSMVKLLQSESVCKQSSNFSRIMF